MGSFLHMMVTWLQKGFQAVIAVAPLALRLNENSINERDLRWVYPHAMRKSSADDFWIQSALAYLLQSNEKETYRSVISLRNNWFSDGGEGIGHIARAFFYRKEKYA